MKRKTDPTPMLDLRAYLADRQEREHPTTGASAEVEIVLKVTRRRRSAYAKEARARKLTLPDFVMQACDAAAKVEPAWDL